MTKVKILLIPVGHEKTRGKRTSVAQYYQQPNAQSPHLWSDWSLDVSQKITNILLLEIRHNMEVTCSVPLEYLQRMG